MLGYSRRRVNVSFRKAAVGVLKDRAAKEVGGIELLEWLDGHPGASLELAARDLGLEQVEALCADLVAAGMIDRVRLQ